MRKFAFLVVVMLVFALAAWSQQPASGDAQGSSSSQGSMSSQQSNPSADQGTEHHGHMAKTGKTAHVTGCLSGPNAEGAYELTSGKHKVEVGGNDELKNHVGHKVTVTGEWASAADIGESATAEKNEKGGEKAEKHLKATSIKMVSESCEKAATSSKKSY